MKGLVSYGWGKHPGHPWLISPGGAKHRCELVHSVPRIVSRMQAAERRRELQVAERSKTAVRLASKWREIETIEPAMPGEASSSKDHIQPLPVQSPNDAPPTAGGNSVHSDAAGKAPEHKKSGNADVPAPPPQA